MSHTGPLVPDSPVPLSLVPWMPPTRELHLIDAVSRVHAERDEHGVVLAAVQAVERVVAGASSALFQVDPDSQVVSLRAAGPRWRTAERDAPAWLTRETGGIAGFARGGTTCAGRWWRRGGTTAETTGSDIARVRVMVSDALWGMLVVVCPAADEGRGEDAWFIEALAAQVGLALQHVTERADLQRSLTAVREARSRATRDDRLLMHFGTHRNTEGREPTSLADLAEASVALVRSRLAVPAGGDVDARLSIDCDVDALVDVDPAAFREVLVNLLTNALEASPQGGDVVIRIGSEGSDAFAAVIDHGRGMDEATCGRVFEPFFTTKRSPGAGLGLSLCCSVVQGHGGRIDVASTRGVGTTFTVWLPAVDPKRTPKDDTLDAAHGQPALITLVPRPGPAESLGESRPVTSGRILFIDDQADVRSRTCDRPR